MALSRKHLAVFSTVGNSQSFSMCNPSVLLDLGGDTEAILLIFFELVAVTLRHILHTNELVPIDSHMTSVIAIMAHILP